MPSAMVRTRPQIRCVRLFFSSPQCAQVSVTPDGLVKGRLGEDMTVEQGQQAARACGINLLALKDRRFRVSQFFLAIDPARFGSREAFTARASHAVRCWVLTIWPQLSKTLFWS